MVNVVELPIVQTFSGIAFTQAILLQHGRTKNEIYNNYINLYIDKLEYKENPELNFPGVLAEDYRLRKVFWGDLYRDNEERKIKFIPLVKHLVRKKKYIYVYDFDDFYAPYSPWFMKEHKAHDVYIYGYDRENFYVMAYAEGKLRKMLVKQKWIEEGYLRRGGMSVPAHVSTMQLSVKRYIKINEKRIIESIKCYLDGRAHSYPTRSQEDIEKKAYGVAVYKELEKYIDIIFEKKQKIDIRIFRLFWEHKVMMTLRIEKMASRYAGLWRNIDEYKKVEQNTEILFRMAIKHSMDRKEDMLVRMKQRLQNICKMECDILNDVLNEMKK